MNRNVELLQQTMQYIKDNPERHDQKVWMEEETTCGTVACLAGWAAHLSGWSYHRILDNNMWSAGADLLGLSLSEAETLFHAKNTVPMLELMVKDLVNGDELFGWGEYYEAGRIMKTATEVDVAPVEQLDFEPACTARNPRSSPDCQRPAVWIRVKRCGHVGFVCDPCNAKQLDEHRLFQCRECGAEWSSASEGTIEMRRL